MNSNLLLYHVEFFNPWNLLLRMWRGWMPSFSCWRSWGMCAIRNESDLLQFCDHVNSSFHDYLLGLYRGLFIFIFKWSATLSPIQPQLLPSEMNLKCPPLESCPDKFLFYPRPCLAILNSFILWRGTTLCIMYWMLPSYLAEGHCLLRQSWHWEWKQMGKGCVFEFTSCYLCPWAHGMEHV